MPKLFWNCFGKFFGAAIVQLMWFSSPRKRDRSFIRSEEPAPTNMDITTGHMVLVRGKLITNLQKIHSTNHPTFFRSIRRLEFSFSKDNREWSDYSTRHWRFFWSFNFSVLHGRSPEAQGTHERGMGFAVLVRGRSQSLWGRGEGREPHQKSIPGCLAL